LVQESISGRFMTNYIVRLLKGNWNSILIQSEELFGERGYTLAVLLLPRTLQYSKKRCEEILQRAGFNITWVLESFDQPYTKGGLQEVIMSIRSMIGDDICLQYLKCGRCRQKSCILKHYKTF
jgi:hypothetical protein